MLQKHFTDWRASLARCTGAAAVVATINIVCLAIAAPRVKGYDQTTTLGDVAWRDGAIFDGDCAEAKQMNMWLHLAINILSTVLLTSGNFAQQMLTAPTRDEIDKAHINKEWLDIGIPSYRNLGRISWKRVFVWIILALTSIPIHLFYNSVVSLETSVNQYNVWLVAEANVTNPAHSIANGKSLDDLIKLDNEHCIAAYGRRFVTDYADVVIVVETDASAIVRSNALLEKSDPFKYNGYGWMCSGGPSKHSQVFCDIPTLASDAGNWEVVDIETRTLVLSERKSLRVKYCLGEPTEEKCKLTVSISLLATVVACNIIKLMGLAMVWLFLDTRPLLTLGDVIMSLLERPDPLTVDRRLLSMVPGQTLSWDLGTRPWMPSPHRWAFFVSTRRYVTTIGLCIAALVAASVLLGQGIDHITIDGLPSFADLWNRGFGTIDVDCLISFDKDGTYRNSATGIVLVSNLPQLLVSLIYTSINGVWTTMLVGSEWNSYGLQRKSLRTTSPIGKQRKTHWLSLPWRYGTPLVAISVALHWLISQAIFFVRLIINKDDRIVDVITTPGYSPIAIIFSMICGAVITLSTISLGLKRFKPAVPQVGTCSAVVSAACQRPEADHDAAMDLVKWGVISNGDGDDYCCITSWPTEVPEAGKSY